MPLGLLRHATRPIDARIIARAHARTTWRSVHMATIVSHDIHNTQPQHIISNIAELGPWDPNTAPLALFFLTPSISNWLLDDTFLINALHRAYHFNTRRPETELTIHTLCAVVDKLPGKGSPSVPVSPAEGVAYALMSKTSLLEPAPEERLDIPDPASTSKDLKDQGILSIHQGFKPRFHQGKTSWARYSDTIHLPLANTVFHTGRPTTLIYSQWTKAKGTTELKLKEKKYLGNGGIRWPGTLQNQKGFGSGRTSSVKVPLVPLTEPRTIAAGLGNIVRRIIGPDGKEVGASQELERAVPEYFKAKGIPPQAMSVWALVIPGEAKAISFMTGVANRALLEQFPGETVDMLPLEVLWRQSARAWDDIVAVAMAHGGRLHRVLSGGGGWGNKAGLLSLDPSLHSDNPDMFSKSFEANFMNASSGGASASHDIVQPGKFIQFFASHEDDLLPRPDVGLDVANMFPVHLEFGTVPSTVDAIPQAPVAKAGANGEPPISVFRRRFGALSEAGISITRKSREHIKGPWVPFTETKIDVPYSRFTTVESLGIPRHRSNDEGPPEGAQMDLPSTPATKTHEVRIVESEREYPIVWKKIDLSSTTTKPFAPISNVVSHQVRQAMKRKRSDLNNHKYKSLDLPNVSTDEQAAAEPPRPLIRKYPTITPSIINITKVRILDWKRINERMSLLDQKWIRIRSDVGKLIATIRYLQRAEDASIISYSSSRSRRMARSRAHQQRRAITLPLGGVVSTGKHSKRRRAHRLSFSSPRITAVRVPSAIEASLKRRAKGKFNKMDEMLGSYSWLVREAARRSALQFKIELRLLQRLGLLRENLLQDQIGNSARLSKLEGLQFWLRSSLADLTQPYVHDLMMVEGRLGWDENSPPRETPKNLRKIKGLRRILTGRNAWLRGVVELPEGYGEVKVKRRRGMMRAVSTKKRVRDPEGAALMDEIEGWLKGF